jgi:hypothetical protein
MDQMNKGVPVAWAIVEHERTVDYTKFLQVLKTRSSAGCRR